MDTPDVQPRSHLFTVRVWEEQIGADQTEWRGKVQLLSVEKCATFAIGRHWYHSFLRCCRNLNQRYSSDKSISLLVAGE